MRTALRKFKGKCLQCGQDTELFGFDIGGQFVGKKYCDACCEAWEADQKNHRFIEICRKYNGVCFENSNPRIEAKRKTAYGFAKAWKPLTSNVFIAGHVGTGKSYLATCMACKAEAHFNYSVERLSALRFCDRVSSRFNAKSTGQLDELTWVSVLVLDDVDKGTWNSVSLTWLWEILDLRRTAGRSTIFTSNYAIEELERELEQYAKNKALPKAIIDRFKPYLEIVLMGESLRDKEETLQQASQQQELVYE